MHKRSFAERHFTILLALILLVGAILRIAGFGWGLPEEKYYPSLEEDEKYYLMTVGNVDLFKFDLDPNFYIHGPLVTYLWEMTLSAARITGLADHQIDEERFSKDPHAYRRFILIGRFQAWLVGMAFLLVVALAFRRPLGADTALLATAILAVTWEPVVHSHLVRHDLPTALFLTGMVAQGYRVIKPGRTYDYLIMGVLMGFATLAIYVVGVYLGGATLLVAHLQKAKIEGDLSWRSLLDSRLIKAIGAAALTFFVFAPYSIYKLPTFLSAFSIMYSGWETDIWRVTRLTKGPMGALYLLAVVTPHALGYFFCAAGYAAIIYGWIKKRGQWVLLLIIPTMQLISLALITQKFSRHLIFLAAPLALLVARFLLYDLKEFLHNRSVRFANTAVFLIASLVIAGSLGQTLAVNYLSQKNQIPEEVSEWFEQNIPTGTKIAVNEGVFFSLIPPLDPRHYPDNKARYDVPEPIEHDKDALLNSEAEYFIDAGMILYGLHDKYRVEDCCEKHKTLVRWLESGEVFKKAKTFRIDPGWLGFLYDVKRLPLDMHRVNPQVEIFKRVHKGQ